MGPSRVARPLAALLVAVALAGCFADADSDSGDQPPTSTTGATIEWGAVEEAKIRPGVRLGDYCTFNWLWADADGNAYIGTAGHCTEKLGETVTLENGESIGRVVYDSDKAAEADPSADPTVDFSLVRLDDNQIGAAHPQMMGYDAPKGYVTASDVSEGDLVGLHGYGMVLGENDVTRDRQGVLFSMTENRYQADMPAVYGDSGSPLVHVSTGKALGIISQFGFLEVPPSTDVGPTIPFILSELEKGGFVVELATV